MTKIIQRVHGLLGTEENINALAKMKHASILAVSDSHGARQMLLSIINAKGDGCDALIFCGDGVSDLLSCISSNSMPPVAAFVRGNNDYEKYTLGTCEITAPARQVLQAAGHTFFIAHGHIQGVRAHYAAALNSEANMAGADMVLFGHTHVAEYNGNMVNPGSLKYPRGMNGPSFAILEVQNGGGIDAVHYCITATLLGIKFKPFRAN